MNKKYTFTLWTMALYFSWFLAFPYFGSILDIISQSVTIESNQISLTFIASHALGFLAGAFLLRETYIWRKLIISSLVALVILNLSLLVFPSELWLPVTALIGLVSSLYILAWSVLFSSFSTLEKIKLYALALIIATLISLVISIFSSLLAPIILLLLNIIPLFAALVLVALKRHNITIDLQVKKNSVNRFPTYFVVILFLIVFLLHFSFGFMFALIDGSFPFMAENKLALDYYSYIPYLFACLIIFRFAHIINLRYMPQPGISLFGLAFILIILLNNNSRGFYLTVSMIESAVVIISVFIWVMQGELSRTYAAPYRFFGFGLFTTLLAVFFGNIFGESLLRYDDTFLINATLYTVAAIFITMVSIPWLLDRISADISTGKIKSEDRLVASGREDNLVILYEKAGLTEREKQVAALLCQGKTNKVMAEKLFISENTLKTHLRNIYEKFNIYSKNELIAHLATWTERQAKN